MAGVYHMPPPRAPTQDEEGLNGGTEDVDGEEKALEPFAMAALS